MAIRLLRHGAVEREYQGRYIGWSDIPLDKKQFNKDIKELQGVKFDRVFSSTLSRCVDTLKLLGFRDFTLDERIKEVKFKDYIESKSFDEISQRDDFDSSYLDSLNSWHNYIASESKEAFRGRIESFLNELNPNEEILICTHGGVIREILLMCGYKEYINLDYLSVVEVDLNSMKL